MKKPRIRGKLAPKSVVNPKHGMQFVPVVGKFMVNFGAVELLTYAWFDHQARDDVLIDHAFTLPFGRRVDLILKMVEREGMPDEWKERSTNA